ncbi:MAG: DUF4355 domain-containing protein [Clostridia bacterium]|nr:DUF4355 domain-containing protein [Clostridia bacterium]
MEEEKKDVGTEEVTTENTGTEQVTETKKKTLDEILAEDKELQSQYDKKVTNSLKTARSTWEEESRTKKEEAEKLAQMDENQKKDYQLQEALKRATEAEKKLSARDLEAETLKQAGEKGISLELIKTIDFERETAESIAKKLEIFEKSLKKEKEKIISEYSKEEPPQTGDYKGTQKSESEMTYEELCNLPKYKN